MRAHLLFVALALCGCKKKAAEQATPSPTAPASTADIDALWALAPDNAIGAVVISPAGLARLEAGALEVNELFAIAPDLAPLKQQLDEAMQEVFGTSNPSLAAAGLTATKGMAVFAAADAERPIVILPVADRDKFLAITKGTKGTDGDTIKRATCKTVKNVYACTRSPEMFERLGKGNMSEQLKLAGARGDIEFAASIPDSPITFAGVAQLARGAVVVRGAVKGIPPEVKELLANVKPRTDGDKTAGFATLNVAPYLTLLKGKVPPLPIVDGVTADALVNSVEGPLSMTIDNGAVLFDVRLPLTDGAAAQKLVEQCDKLEPAKMLGATVKDGVCRVAMPQMQLELEVWVDGKTLRLGKKGATPTTIAAPLSPVAQELASGEWIIAMYGRGTTFGPTAMTLPMPPGQLPADGLMAMRGAAMLNELGFGFRVEGEVVRVVAVVRTAFANPPEVVTKLAAIKIEEVLQGKAGAQGKAIADAHPTTPFATDYKTGTSGLMLPAAMIGMLAGIAVPAYMDYMKKAKRTEAALQLDKLGKNLEVAYVTNAEFPKGTVGPSPAKSCCESQGKCAPDPAVWANPVWQAIEFQLDEPHMFRYSYASADGKSFVAKATGDLDCDGTEVEYVMTGTVDAQGNPTLTIVEPSAGDD